MVALNSDFAASKSDTDTKNRVGRFFSLAAESVGEDRRSSRKCAGEKRGYRYDTTSVDTEFEYGPFGELIRATGEKKDDFNFRFSTKYEDAETGLLYYGFRYYDPATGRWLNRDPIEEQGGLNLYAFVGNNSVNLIDILGNVGYSPYSTGHITYQGASFLHQSTQQGSHSRNPNRSDGSRFSTRFEHYLQPLEGVFESGKETIKEFYTQFKKDAKSRVSFSYDIRKSGFNIGIFKTKYGGVLKVSSDGCCVSVRGGPTFAVSAKGPSLVTIAGGVTVTGSVNYKYCWPDGSEEWSGSIGGTGWIGLRVGLDVWVASAFAEGGVYASYSYNFVSGQDRFGVGGYVRAVFESGLIWKQRRQYKYTIGDPDVHF